MDWNTIIRYVNHGSPAPERRVVKSESDWAEVLEPEAFRVTRLHGTERAHSSDMCSRFEPGLYACVCCGTVLFDANVKFDSGTGWPSFTQPVRDNVVAYKKDTAYGMVRVECLCSTCDAHLGHVFPDGPKPTGLRFCINAVALEKTADAAVNGAAEE